ncbi:hypothetical protein GOP47_0024101 [Adiantum capillus-veneris]|uniref:Reverse transcriptase zinc-binding domain-containing protein n=1 Tax=Adiantum capillus-veneris TaxID=13818 RepID=A0A9D4U4T3_ADICA|nr:hypothetical protein GOP47_0024101 [Adiantum capillus-veneris]
MAVKLVVRAIHHPREEWSVLLLRTASRFRLSQAKGWVNLPFITLFFSPHLSLATGSDLMRSLWGAWNRHRFRLSPNWKSSHSQPLLLNDSIWLPWVTCKDVQVDTSRLALTIHNKGVRVWADVWSPAAFDWLSDLEISLKFQLRPWELAYLRRRLALLPASFHWLLNCSSVLSLKGIVWSGGYLLSHPQVVPKPLSPPLHIILNQRWGLSLDRRQWNFKFSTLWSTASSPKKSALLWLIIYKAVWTGQKLRDAGLALGTCPRCKNCPEDLFMNCSFNFPFWKLVLSCLGRTLSWKNVMLGDNVGIPPIIWNHI